MWIQQQLTPKQTFTDISAFQAFCSRVEIRLKSGGRKSFRVEDWYEEQLRFERQRTGRDIIVKPRQVGFSTLELARDLWYAITHPGTGVLVIVHDGKLADQLFETLRIFADCLKASGRLPRTRYSNKREIVFAESGSAVRIVEAGETSRAAIKKGRSGTVHRLHATEVAYWGAASETMSAVLGSVPDEGEVVIESTANGVGGMFYDDVQAALSGRTRYKLHFFAWWEHAQYRSDVAAGFDPLPKNPWEEKLRKLRCDDEQIAWWRSKVEDPKIGLEQALKDFPIDIDTCFRASGETWFERDTLDEMSEHVREPLRLADLTNGERHFDPVLVYEEPDEDKLYVLFGDVAEGVASDGSAACVLDRDTGRTVATWWSDLIAPGDFGEVLALIGKMYSTGAAPAVLGVERNNHGHATLERIVTALHYPAVFEHDDGRAGWNTNSATRPVLWEDLAHAIREGAAYTPDASTLAECRSIVRDEDGKPRARGKRGKTKDSCRDDRYVAWAGAWQLRTRYRIGGEVILPDVDGSRWDRYSAARGFG